jgi:hypothetical protein
MPARRPAQLARTVPRWVFVSASGLLIQDKFHGLVLGDKWRAATWIVLGFALLVVLLSEDALRRRYTSGVTQDDSDSGCNRRSNRYVRVPSKGFGPKRWLSQRIFALTWTVSHRRPEHR